MTKAIVMAVSLIRSSVRGSILHANTKLLLPWRAGNASTLVEVVAGPFKRCREDLSTAAMVVSAPCDAVLLNLRLLDSARIKTRPASHLKPLDRLQVA